MKMFKNIAATLIAVISMSAHAGSSSRTYSCNGTSGLITPDVATDMFRTTRFIQSATGILICRDDYVPYGKEECTKNGKNAWRRMPDSVPEGKTFVAFSIVSTRNGEMAVEIYWK